MDNPCLPAMEALTFVSNIPLPTGKKRGPYKKSQGHSTIIRNIERWLCTLPKDEWLTTLDISLAMERALGCIAVTSTPSLMTPINNAVELGFLERLRLPHRCYYRRVV